MIHIFSNVKNTIPTLKQTNKCMNSHYIKPKMERLILGELLEWKERKNRKSLVLQGCRQVGKTWILREFGKRLFSKLCVHQF